MAKKHPPLALAAREAAHHGVTHLRVRVAMIQATRPNSHIAWFWPTMTGVLWLRQRLQHFCWLCHDCRGLLSCSAKVQSPRWPPHQRVPNMGQTHPAQNELHLHAAGAAEVADEGLHLRDRDVGREIVHILWASWASARNFLVQ